MTNEDRSTQVKVGIFILIGLVTIGVMVVYFGRLGEGFSDYYNVRVEFSNASGLLRGSEVLLAGAKVGRITNAPTILPDMRGVYVDIRILNQVKIPVGSEFTIGSTGLLGDKFIQINLKKMPDSEAIQPEAVIKGADGSDGIAGMTTSAGELISDLKTTVGNINTAVTRINGSVLSPEELAKISDTIKNLQSSTAKIADASTKVDQLVAQAGKVVQSGQATIDSAKKSSDELQKTLLAIHSLVDQAKEGRGVLGLLISNRETADNLRNFIQNLRQHGILWYKDIPKIKSGDAPADQSNP